MARTKAKRIPPHTGASSAAPKRTRTERNGQLLTKSEVADVLACTESLVEKLTARAQLPHVKLGDKLVRWDRADVDAFIAQQKREGR